MEQQGCEILVIYPDRMEFCGKQFMNGFTGTILAFKFPPVGIIHEYRSEIEPKVLRKAVHALPENDLEWLCGRNDCNDIINDRKLVSLLFNLRFAQFSFGSIDNKSLKCEKVIFTIENTTTLLPYPLFSTIGT